MKRFHEIAETKGTLAVVGAGPKGIAVAVKAKVLEEMGLPVDRVYLIEKNDVAANWSGDFGYTNGEMKLGTSPEKDVVFPLETDVGNEEINRRVRQRLMEFTWGSFMVQTHRFTDWIDRGRPAPCHQLWAAYLRWVASRLEPQVTLLAAEVLQVGRAERGKSWDLTLKFPNETTGRLNADRLMLTGPGKIRSDFGGFEELPSGTEDVESFWGAIKNGQFPQRGKVAVVGAGENAASILLALSRSAPQLEIDVISPKGFVSTRSENSYENRFYSQPTESGWEQMTYEDRVDFIGRTDLGVFSVHAMKILNEETRHRIVPGRVVGISRGAEGIALRLEYREVKRTEFYDRVILATGFDQIATLRSLLSEEAFLALRDAVGEEISFRTLADRIASDLSVEGLRPRLHLPMLAGLAQGPGFSNLSCLGLLADRIVLP